MDKEEGLGSGSWTKRDVEIRFEKRRERGEGGGKGRREGRREGGEREVEI